MFLWCIFTLVQGDAGRIPDFGADFVPSQLGNMNGEYVIQPTPGARPGGRLPKAFRDYPGGVESFDVYSPAMTTLYSQVWTKPLAPVDLPADVVKPDSPFLVAKEKLRFIGSEDSELCS